MISVIIYVISFVICDDDYCDDAACDLLPLNQTHFVTDVTNGMLSVII